MANTTVFRKIQNAWVAIVCHQQCDLQEPLNGALARRAAKSNEERVVSLAVKTIDAVITFVF